MAKVPGFVGLDRSQLPGVDVIANLEDPLPFRDNSVEIVHASHALEHVADLMQTMKEIYRVCRDRSQLCIVAPYQTQGINFANPFHHQGFNEHTPRFWTPSPNSVIPAAEYKHPHAEPWGLSQSDHLDPGIDLRCLRMEFFYFPAYRHLPAEEQRSARKKYIDVCHQIVYHLLVVKEPISERQLGDVAEKIEYFDPPAVALRRLQERVESLEAISEQTSGLLSMRENELETTQSLLSVREAELEQSRRLLIARESDLATAHSLLSARESDLRHVNLRGMTVANELESFRAGRAMRAMLHFFDNSDARDDIAPAFQQLKDDSFSFTRGLRGCRLQLSRNLQHIPYIQYPLELHRANLAGILLAAVLDFPGSAGVIGVEIVSPSNTIVAQKVRALGEVDGSVPCHFGFAPIQDSGTGRHWLRVFVREADVPVRIFEWRKKSAFGFWRPQTMAFSGFIFIP